VETTRVGDIQLGEMTGKIRIPLTEDLLGIKFPWEEALYKCRIRGSSKDSLESSSAMVYPCSPQTPVMFPLV